MGGTIQKVNIVGMGALGMLFGQPIGEYLSSPGKTSGQPSSIPDAQQPAAAAKPQSAAAQSQAAKPQSPAAALPSSAADRGMDDMHAGTGARLCYVMDVPRLLRHRQDTYTINGEVIHPTLISPEEAAADGPADLVLVSVKYPALRAAMDTMESSIGRDTIIISLMNGVDSEEKLAARFGADKVLYAIAQGMDAQRYGTDLRFSVRGQINIGVPRDSPYREVLEGRLKEVLALFDASGVKYVLEDDIIRRLWSKFMLNVGINQVCMAYDASFGEALVPGSEEFALVIAAMREVCLIAQAKGIDVGEKDVAEYIEILHTLSPDASPSMGQDRKARRPSEVDMFGGTMIRLGQELGIAVPVNEYLVRRIKEIEKVIAAQ